MTADAARRAKLRAYGRLESPTVDVTLYREHLQAAVDLGIPVRRIAEITGKARRWIGDVLRTDPKTGRVQQSISVANAEIIASIPLDPALAAKRKHVPARGAVRRLRALSCLGWTPRRLESEAGHDDRYHYYGDLMRAGEDASVTEDVDAEIRELFSKFCLTVPTYPNRIAADAGRRAKDRARRYRWAGPLDWDDIDADDAPAEVVLVPRMEFVDDLVVDLTCSGDRPRRLSHAELRLVVAELHSRLFADTLIAEFAGVDQNTALRIRRDELGLPAVAYAVSVHRRVA